MEATILTTGLACLIAGIIGGGLKMFGIELPNLASRNQRIALGVLGLFLVGGVLLKDPLGRLVARVTHASPQASQTPTVIPAQPKVDGPQPIDQKAAAPPKAAPEKPVPPNDQIPHKPVSVPPTQAATPKTQAVPQPEPVKTAQQIEVEKQKAALEAMLMKYTKEYYAAHPGGSATDAITYVKEKMEDKGFSANFYMNGEKVQFPCRLKTAFSFSGTNGHLSNITIHGCFSDSAIIVRGDGNTLTQATVDVPENETPPPLRPVQSAPGACPPNTAICQLGDGSKTTDSRFYGGRWDHLIFTNGAKSEVANTLYMQELTDATSSPANLQSALETIRSRQTISWASLSPADRFTKEAQANAIRTQIKAADMGDQLTLKSLLQKLIALI